ncbi:unnamed protein product, partial [Scytosiphon promiscuus]
MALPTNPIDGLPGPRSEDSAGGPRVQRVPSFKLSDDDRARSKRFRNRVPSAVGRGDAGDGDIGTPMSSPSIENARASPHLAAPGPRRVSSFTLTGDVFRMSHTSSWGSGVGGNMFGFGPASVDGEGEDIVQRLDDASFNDLNFLTMEGVGPSDLSGKALGESSGAGMNMKANEKRAAGGGRSFDRNSAGSGYLVGGNVCDRPQATVSKEEITANAVIDRKSSGRDILSRASSVRDVLRSGSLGIGESSHDVFGSTEFALDEGLPIFSSSMEEYLNQLEAADEPPDSSAVAGRSCSQITNRGGDASGGNDGEMHAARMAAIRAAGSSHSLTSTRPAGVKSERDRYVCDADGIRRIGACSQSAEVKTEGLKPEVTERRPRHESVSQPQCLQHHKSDGEAESSHSEYEPPAPRKKKPKRRLSKERTTSVATAAAATSTPSAKASGGAPGARVASSMTNAVRRSTPKRQTSEDVAARLPLEVLECFYHVPLNVAAVQLDVSLTMLKKLCRTYGVKRWPHRQVSSLDKTTLKLEEKIKARNDGGKDAPSLVRKLTQAKKRRSVIIKTASAGLDATVLNSIFTCRPGAIDEDLLLSSTNVAEAVEKVHSALEVDHKSSGSESESDGDSDGGSGSGSDHDLDEHDVRDTGLETKPSPGNAKTSPGINMDIANVPPFLKASTVAKSFSAPPPAFEPGGRPKDVASKEVGRKRRDIDGPASTQAVARPRAGAKHGKKTERAMASAKRTRKVVASKSKGRQHATAGRDGSYTPASPCLDGSGESLGGIREAGGSGADLTSLSFGNPPRGRAQATGYSGSGVFGIGLRHQSSGVSSERIASTIPSGAASAARLSSRIVDPPRPRAVPGIPRPQESTRTPARADAVGKRALGYREWRGGASCSQSTPSSQRHLGHTGSESPTATAAALDGFDSRLSLESPSRGPHHASAAPQTPPQPLHPHGRYPYLIHPHFPPHHRPHPHPSFHNLGWVGGQYPWLPHQPYGFPVELMSPIDTRLPPPPQRGSSGRNFDAFSKADDRGEDAG